MITEAPERPQTQDRIDDKPKSQQREQPRTTPKPPNGKRRRVSILIFVSFIVIGAAAGLWWYLSTMGLESTDDAFIAANVYRLAPRIDGRIDSIPVKDNEVVQEGALIARIDPADYQARVDQFQAALNLAQAKARAAEVQVGIVDATTQAAVEQASAQLQAAQARLEQEQAGLESAKAEADRASADLERYSQLSEQAVSQQRLDLARSAATTAQAQVRAAQKRVVSAQAEIVAAQAQIAAAEAGREQVAAAKAELEQRQAEVAQAQAELDESQLELSYTTIQAPQTGRVTNKAFLEGDYVKTGQPLMALVSSEVWVVANFKETQLEHIRPGQPVTIHIDAYDADFPGHVDSIQSGSGAAFSLLPPQNATGNYVKVVQRVPVKIVFDQIPDPERYRLGPGMSVVPEVKIE